MMEAAAGDYRVVGQPGYKVIVRSLDDMRALYGAVDAVGLGGLLREQMNRAIARAIDDADNVAAITLDPGKLRVFQMAEAALKRYSAPDGMTSIERMPVDFAAVMARLDDACLDDLDRRIALFLTARVAQACAAYAHTSGAAVVFVDRATLRLFNKADALAHPPKHDEFWGSRQLVKDVAP